MRILKNWRLTAQKGIFLSIFICLFLQFKPNGDEKKTLQMRLSSKYIDRKSDLRRIESRIELIGYVLISLCDTSTILHLWCKKKNTMRFYSLICYKIVEQNCMSYCFFIQSNKAKNAGSKTWKQGRRNAFER